MAAADPKKKKKKRKKKESLEHKRNRILVALGIFAVVYALDELGALTIAFGEPGNIYASFALFLVPFLIAGYDVLQKAFNNIRRGKAFDESFLMAVATIGAFAMVLFPDTDPHMAEGAAVMLFYQVGELFQAYAVGKSRKSISAMMDIAPDYANVEQPDGTLEQVFPDDIAVGTVIVVKPGERVPIDGIIVEGETQLDTAALTGESVPRPAKTGDDIISGCINMTGLIHVRTTKPFGESTVARVLELVENASEKKARTENFITRFARRHRRGRGTRARRRFGHRRLVRLDPARPDLPGRQLPVCARDQRAAQFLWRHRRRVQAGRSHQGFQLPRDARRCGHRRL